MNHEQIAPQPVEYESHERQTTDEEYEAGADFSGIAERIDLMMRLPSIDKSFRSS